MNNSNEKQYWLTLEKILQDLLNQFTNKLDIESIESVQHYLDHSEYEMAFEGLFIELMKLNINFTEVELKKYIALGEELGLSEDSVFDSEFWVKFLQYSDQQKQMG